MKVKTAPKRVRSATEETATDVKNEFGKMLNRVGNGETVLITKRGKPEAVLLSVKEYEALGEAEDRALEALDDRFEEMFGQMQTPETRKAADEVFTMSGDELAEAARTYRQDAEE